MANRFVLLSAENQFNRGEMSSGRLAMARVALRAPVRSAMATAPSASAGMASMAASIGLSAADLAAADASGPPLRSLHVVRRLPDDDGPILLELDDEDRLSLQREYPGARLVAEGTARMAFMSLLLQEVATMTGAGEGAPRKLRVKLSDEKRGKPLKRTEVQCIMDRRFKPPIGATALTDAKGVALFLVPARFKKVEVVANPRHSVWPAARKRIVLAQGTTTIDLACPNIVDSADCARALFVEAGPASGSGVVVAVVDGGAGRHPLLTIAKGANLVDGESEGDFRDNGIGHGTHVAGLIAGVTSGAFRGGFAQGVTLNVYRVYPKGQTSTGSFAIAEGIRQAVDDGADLINLSLTLDSDQPEIVRELKRARARGIGVIAAAGNSSGSVMFPARLSGVVAVSAMGIKGCAPAGSSVEDELLDNPRGSDRTHRIARFSCTGPEIDLIGPGVGMVSLFPGGKRAIMNGTSMAAPVVTARTANALAASPAVLQRSRVQARSDAISQLALRAAKDLGFGARVQGQGLPR